MKRAHMITAAAFAGNLGWGTILPFQYAYVVDARHWGPTAGVLTGTLFCLGAVVAAPLAGRLADRVPAARLAFAFSMVAAAVCLGMAAASTAPAFLVAMLLFGAAVTAAQPPAQVLLLECVAPEQRRSAFANQFTAMALGMAVGAFAAGQWVDLSSPAGMLAAFVTAGAGFAVSAVLLGSVGTTASAPHARTAAAQDAEGAQAERSGLAAYRAVFASRPVRLFAVASMLLAAGFYAQFETGLPAFALQSLHVSPRTVGTAAAVNCVVIVAVQWLVVRLTGSRPGAGLLAIVGTIWALTWLTLGSGLLLPVGQASVVFVLTFGAFAVGETMYAPVLGPLAASVAPEGLLGTTLGAVSALRTAVSSAGPLVAGVLITAHLSSLFVGLHVAINAAGAGVAWRLHRSGRAARERVDNGRTDVRSTRV